MFEKCHAKVHFHLWFTFEPSTTQTTPTKWKRVHVTKKTPLVRAPDRRTGDLWLKSRLRQKFFSQYLSFTCWSVSKNLCLIHKMRRVLYLFLECDLPGC